MPDLIHVKGLEVLLFCGVLPEEQERRQPFRIDVIVEADVSAAGASDDLADTVNYGDLADRIVAAIVDRRYQLLERLATHIAEICLDTDGVDAVTVSVDKLRPPIAHHAAATGVTIRRERP